MTALGPEALARIQIDAQLAASGWVVQDRSEANVYAAPGVAIREVPLEKGHGRADYLLFLDGKAVGAFEAKKAGTTLTGIEIQADKYSEGLPSTFKAPLRPLPFVYIGTGEATAFFNQLDPAPRTREIFAIHRPETLAEWLNAHSGGAGGYFRRGLRAFRFGSSLCNSTTTLTSPPRAVALRIVAMKGAG